MKILIANLIASSLSLNAMAAENPRPELDSTALQQEMLALHQQASQDVLAEAIHNLKPLALETLVVEASSADATHPES